jgi:hypothetical protein
MQVIKRRFDQECLGLSWFLIRDKQRYGFIHVLVDGVGHESYRTTDY